LGGKEGKEREKVVQKKEKKKGKTGYSDKRGSGGSCNRGGERLGVVKKEIEKGKG